MELVKSASGESQHLVQFYEADELFLARNVSHFLWEGLKRGDGLLVIAGAERSEAFSHQLTKMGADLQAAARDGHLVFLDAQETLAKFMVAGRPDWVLFESAIRAAMQTVHTRAFDGGLRAYGEMVGILWKAGQFSAAARLERFWNRLLHQSRFSLFCGYPIDVFGKEFRIDALDDLLCAHTHLVPAGANGDLERAVDQSMDEVLGARANGLRLLMKANFRPSWAAMPRGEASILWLRNNLEDDADEILTRARKYYRQSQNLAAAVCNSHVC